MSVHDGHFLGFGDYIMFHLYITKAVMLCIVILLPVPVAQMTIAMPLKYMEGSYSV